MTAQIPEKLLLNGETLTLCSEPLTDYFAVHGKPIFVVNCTALLRGYVGTWEIRDGRLFLVDIKAEYRNGSPVSLAGLFKNNAERVFARWFTGTLRCPRGGELKYVHMGYESIYENDLLFHIDHGQVTAREVRVNGTAVDNARQGFRPAAFTTFPLCRKPEPDKQ